MVPTDEPIEEPVDDAKARADAANDERSKAMEASQRFMFGRRGDQSR
jgi:hypothetical protein